MAHDTLEHPPLADVAGVIDQIHGATPEALDLMRPDIIEFLECCCDFLALQAAAIQSYRIDGEAKIAKADPVPPRAGGLSRVGEIRLALLSGIALGFVGGVLPFVF